MITKGIVTEIISDYTASVRIPVYDGKEGTQGSTRNSDLGIAAVCALPNSIMNLVKGDIVWVGFEDNDTSKPIILGFLQKKTGAQSSFGLNVSTLKTESTTTLNEQTFIGNVQPSEIKQLIGVKDSIQGQFDYISERIDNIDAIRKEDLDDLDNRVTTLRNDLTTEITNRESSDSDLGERVYQLENNHVITDITYSNGKFTTGNSIEVSKIYLT